MEYKQLATGSTDVKVKQIIHTTIDNCIEKCDNETVIYFLKSLENYIQYSGESTYPYNVKNYIDVLGMHSINVAYINYLIGITKFSDLGETISTDLVECGLIHDIGKLFIDVSILEKNGRLTLEERDVVENHPELGYNILIKDNYFKSKQEILAGTLHHHERLDGTGYPYGVTGESINLFARIISVADSYEAMTSYRIYNNIKHPIEAIRELESMDNKYDKQLVDILMERFNSKLHEF